MISVKGGGLKNFLRKIEIFPQGKIEIFPRLRKIEIFPEGKIEIFPRLRKSQSFPQGKSSEKISIFPSNLSKFARRTKISRSVV